MRVETEISVDLYSMRVMNGPRTSARLTLRELQIASLLRDSPNHCCSREQILKEVWRDGTGDSRSFGVCLARLRRKLVDAGLVVRHIPPDRYCMEQVSRAGTA